MVSEGVKELVSVLLCECPTWLRETPGVREGGLAETAAKIRRARRARPTNTVVDMRRARRARPTNTVVDMRRARRARPTRAITLSPPGDMKELEIAA